MADGLGTAIAIKLLLTMTAFLLLTICWVVLSQPLPRASIISNNIAPEITALGWFAPTSERHGDSAGLWLWIAV